MKAIALLTSTRPVCREVSRPGSAFPKRTIDSRAVTLLAQKYGLIIIGSGSSDKVYDRIKQCLPSGLRQRIRSFSRAYFDQFASPDRDEDEQFNEGWKSILKANKIFFITEREIVDQDFSTSFQSFNWRLIENFISDERVDVIKDRQQILGAD